MKLVHSPGRSRIKNKHRVFPDIGAALLLGVVLACSAPLARPVWAIEGWKTEGPVNRALEAFIETAEKEIPAGDRIAVFDMDGTLIEEKPAPVTLFQYWEAHHGLLRDYAGIGAFQTAVREYTDPGKHDKAAMLGWYNTLEWGSPLGAYEEKVSRFLDLKFSRGWEKGFWDEMKPVMAYPAAYEGKTYRELVYPPMVNLIRRLREAGFEVWILTGSGKYFARLLAPDFGVPASRFIGNEPALAPSPRLDEEIITKTFIVPAADERGKVTRLLGAIGKKPVFGAGNTGGDSAFMNYIAAGNKYPHLNIVIVHHDKGEAEKNSYRGYPAYGKGSFEEEAEKSGWLPVFMGGDWDK